MALTHFSSHRLGVSPDLPVAVVGGGPVGSALALFLARAGVSVALLDAGASERKVCGEGLLPAGWRVLEELGLDSAIQQRGAIEGLRYTLACGPTRESMRAPLKGAAFGVQRPHLYGVFRDALRGSSVQLYEEARVQDFQVCGNHLKLRFRERTGSSRSLSCSYLFGADGLHSLVRRKAGLQSARTPEYRRWGTRCYFRSSEERRAVEVTLGEGVESYLTPLGSGLYGLAFLWSPERLPLGPASEGTLVQRLLKFFPEDFEESLPSRKEAFQGGERGLGPLQQLVSTPLHSSGRIALAGDAAGYFDALTGEGLCLGLCQAKTLAQDFLAGRLQDYPRHHRSLKFRHRLVVSALLTLLHRPTWRDRVFRALFENPRQFQALLGFAVDERSWLSLLSPDFPGFLGSLLKSNNLETKPGARHEGMELL